MNQSKPKKNRQSAFAAREELDSEGVLEGKNALWEALNQDREIDKIFFAKGSAASLGHIIAKAREKGVPVVECDRRKLDKLSATGSHQGVIAMVAAAQYLEVEDMLALARRRKEAPVLVLCDGITDAHNLGAIIRSVEVSGAHGVIVPRRRSAGLNAACAKAAAGALEHVPVAKCANLQTAMIQLKKQNFFIYAADMGGTPMYQVSLTGPLAIVIGSEGSGVSRLVRESCDGVISIPQRGCIQSLNASNAAAVLLYEALRQRSQA